jgi:transcriptional regulator with XRE-family HTH domain
VFVPEVGNEFEREPYMSHEPARPLIEERLLSLAEAAARVPSFCPGRRTSVGCIMRWILKGVKTTSGLVRLKAIRLGGRWLTSVEALERFAAAQTPDLESKPALPGTPAARRRASEEAAGDLHRTFIGSVERGERNVSLLNLRRIAGILRIPLVALFSGLR